MSLPASLARAQAALLKERQALAKLKAQRAAVSPAKQTAMATWLSQQEAKVKAKEIEVAAAAKVEQSKLKRPAKVVPPGLARQAKMAIAQRLAIKKNEEKQLKSIIRTGRPEQKIIAQAQLVANAADVAVLQKESSKLTASSPSQAAAVFQPSPSTGPSTPTTPGPASLPTMPESEAVTELEKESSPKYLYWVGGIAAVAILAWTTRRYWTK